MAFTIVSSLPPASNLGIIFWNSYVIEMRGLSLECIKSLLNFAYILSEGASLRLLFLLYARLFHVGTVSPSFTYNFFFIIVFREKVS